MQAFFMRGNNYNRRMFHFDAQLWGWISMAIAVVSYLPYYISIFRGHTKPHAFSWFVWGPLTLIAFFAQDMGGAGAGAWATGLTGLLSLFIGVLALFYGEREITRADRYSFAAALCVIPAWCLTRDALAAVVLVVIIDALGFYPTFRKTLRKPHEEFLFTYWLCAIQFFVSLLALERFNLTTALYPVSIVVMNSAFVIAVMRRRRCHKKEKLAADSFSA
jgi:hypothetical protein